MPFIIEYGRIERLYLVLSILFSVANLVVGGDAVSLNKDNIQPVLNRNDLVFVNFYADWCRFSQILAPVFDKAAKKLSEEFQPGRVILAKVDCDREVEVASRYHISKYPTLKLFRNGQMVKKEHRGQRSEQALVDFIRNELVDPVSVKSTVDELDDLNIKKRNMIGYFESKESDNYASYARLANLLRDDCMFHAAFGSVSEAERTSGDFVEFRSTNTRSKIDIYSGLVNNYDQLHGWASDKCMPLVREITFNNAEELTEEGLPFMILFHHPDDLVTLDRYNTEVARQLSEEKSTVNVLAADGTRFTHPLHHLGKSVTDLPILAIDSFRHMFLFPHDVKTHLGRPGLLKQFVDDLHSGRLHREFHHGPDSTKATSTESVITSTSVGQTSTNGQHLPKDVEEGETKSPGQVRRTSPPESLFRKLAPSRSRYTILRDEL